MRFFRPLAFSAAVLGFTFAAALSGCGSAPAQREAGAVEMPSGELRDAVRVVPVTAKQFKFVPNRIVVHSGEEVKLLATSVDVRHGFRLEAYGINRLLEPGQPETIIFTAGQPGVYPFRCSVFCGLGHFGMSGELVVLPPKDKP